MVHTIINCSSVTKYTNSTKWKIVTNNRELAKQDIPKLQ